MNEKAIIAFMNTRDNVRAQLKRLDAMLNVEDHYSPDEINWPHVGDLNYVEELLREAIRFLGSRDMEED